MRKLFTYAKVLGGLPAVALAKVGLLLIVALQWSFTPSDTGKGPLTPYFADTTTTPGGSVNSYFSISRKMSVYDSLHLQQAGLSKKVFAMALKGMAKLVNTRHIKDNLLAIVDFSQPSSNRRLYVIDLNTYELLYNTYVAHGMKTGKAEGHRSAISILPIKAVSDFM